MWPKLPYNMVTGFQEQERREQKLYDLASKVTAHQFYHILFIRSPHVFKGGARREFYREGIRSTL